MIKSSPGLTLTTCLDIHITMPPFETKIFFGQNLYVLKILQTQNVFGPNIIGPIFWTLNNFGPTFFSIPNNIGPIILPYQN